MISRSDSVAIIEAFLVALTTPRVPPPRMVDFVSATTLALAGNTIYRNYTSYEPFLDATLQ
jgi:hypothetical protein